MSHNTKTHQSIMKARKGRGFIPPRYSPLIRKIVRMLTPLYIKHVEGVSSVTVENLDILFDACKDHFSKKKKLIIAFRHVAKEDAPVLMHVIHNSLNKKIKAYNKSVDKEHHIIGHAQFLYGTDVLEWASSLAVFIFPRLGAIGVTNRSNNKMGVSLLKETMKSGIFPIALAPESQVTYHMGKVAQTSSGISSLSLWGEHVSVLPIALGYHHKADLHAFIIEIIERWEKETGIISNKENSSLYESLLFITEATVTLLEDFYHLHHTSETQLQERIDTICLKAMSYAEHIAQTKGSGTILDRLLHIRHMGISAQKPDDFELQSTSPLAVSLLDTKALHAHIFLMHSQIVDVLQYVDPSYITPIGSLERMSEYALNILDVVNRMKGGNINSRYSPKKKHAFLYIGGPIDILHEPNLLKKENRKNIDNRVKVALQEVSKELELKWMNTYQR